MTTFKKMEPVCLDGRGQPQSLPDRFGLLCWNVHKSRRTGAYRRVLQQWHEEWNLHILLLQEARIRSKGSPFLIPDFSYCASANIRLPSIQYGLLSAASTPSEEVRYFPSTSREGMLGPGKGALLTTYRCGGGEELVVLNLHAINFRSSKVYADELAMLYERIQDYTGAMIVAGDFNSWSAARQRTLEEFRLKLGLDSVPYERSAVKSFRGYPLDRIMFRNMKLLRKETYSLPGFSDHNALLAEFSITAGH